MLVLHSNKLHSAIFGATFRRGIARDRPSFSITFGAQPAAVYSMLREPVDHRLGAFTRQFQVSFFSALIVRKSLDANLPVGMLLERSECFIQCTLGVRRQLRAAGIEMYI